MDSFLTLAGSDFGTGDKEKPPARVIRLGFEEKMESQK
jgi:hypothetical protein